jgi:hyperosmotically inducible periplasmic protein
MTTSSTIVNSRNIAALCVAALLVATLAACEKKVPPDQPKTAGQKLDSVIEKTNEKIGDISNKVGAQIDKAGDAVSNSVSNTATGMGATANKAGDVLSDAAITTSINADLLKDPELSVIKIDVDTKAGKVTLNGLTPNEGARLRAGKIAASIKGVTAVENYLTVKK